MSERGYWSNQTEFILTCLGYAVGLGNVWRFPYMCARGGGAAFLIPYFITLILAAFPLFYVELALGQFAQLTPALLYERMAPAFAGLGPCMILTSIYTSVAYIVIIAWSLHYLGNTFRKTLPWSNCDNEFNTCDCVDINTRCSNTTTYFQGKCRDLAELANNWTGRVENCWTRNVNASQLNGNQGKWISYTAYQQYLPKNQTNYTVSDVVLAKIDAIYKIGTRNTPPKEYLDLRVLHKAENLDPATYGTPHWELVLALLGAWILVFLTLFRGPKTSGKVVYFTALFPYVILLVLLIRGCTLEHGVGDGLRFFVEPHVNKLADGGTWGSAAQQVLFSLSLASAGLTTVASYNRFHNNLFRDTLIVVIGNCATSIFAGFVVFPVIGYAAYITQTPVDQVAGGGPGLVFELYPLAINQMAVPQLWCFLLFFMLVLLGIDSEMVAVETIVTCIVDAAPALQTPLRKVLVLGGVCFTGFILGLMFITPGGYYLHDLVAIYGAGYPLLFAGLTEIILVAHVYGIRRFIGDVNLMLGSRPNKVYRWLHPCSPINVYWIANWLFFTPLVLVLVTVFLIFSEATKNRTTPGWDVALGWLMTFTCVGLIPVVAIYKVVQNKKAGKPPDALFRPTEDWGPTDPDIAAAYRKAHNRQEKEEINLGYDEEEE